MGTSLITGATGFIGWALARRLAAGGESLKCLVRRRSEKTERLESLGAELVMGDVNQPEAVADSVVGCDTIYHGAGLRCALSRDALFRVNGQGSGLLAEAAASQPSPPTFVLISSAAAGGPAARDQQRRENEPAAPVSDYGRSKLAGEQAVVALADRLPVSIVRPGIVFGPENEELLPVFKSIYRLGLHVSAGMRSPPIALIHIDDLLQFLIVVAEQGERASHCSLGGQDGQDRNCSEKKLGQGVYNACADEQPTYRRLGTMIGWALGRRRVHQLPLFVAVARSAAGVSTIWQRIVKRPDVFNLDKIREARAPSWACDTEKAKQLGLSTPTSLQERLNETARWYLQHEWL